jgi:PAS domain S-box-containing protein
MTTPATARERILVVDDEENVLFTIGTILADRGYDVVTLESGRAAIERLGREAFDLVLTDLSLRDTDGLEVLAAVREKQADAVAIMLTGYASLDSAIEAIRRGAYDYLTKPTNVEEMVHTIERGLEKRRLALALRRRVEQLTTLHRLAGYGLDEVLRSALGIDEALAGIARIVVELFAPGAAIAIFLEEGGRLVPRAREAEAGAGREILDGEAALRAVEAAARSREAVLLSGETALLAAPIVWHERTLGALLVASAGSRTWTDEEVRTATTIAGRAALAIANADLYRTVVEERETLGLILDAAGDGIIGLDAEGRIAFASRAAERLLGCSAEALRSRAIEAFTGTHPSTESLPALRARAAGAPGGVTSGEVLFRGPRGGDIFCDVICCEVDGRRSGAVRTVLSLRDARERRAIEEQKTSVLSHLTHELKTPLTSILAYTYLMHSGKLGPIGERQAQALRTMRRNGQQLLALIQNMLVTAQISQGRARFRLQPARVAPLLAELRECFEPIAIERGVSFTVVEDPGLEVHADPEMLSMALNNLVSNALRFTDEGGAVAIEAREAGCEVRFEVRDTGIGIPEEFQERIFQRYFQVDGSRGGTGLGLEIVKSIVEAHGGRIAVESRIGHGARFHFAIPKATAPEPASEASTPAPSAATP